MFGPSARTVNRLRSFLAVMEVNPGVPSVSPLIRVDDIKRERRKISIENKLHIIELLENKVPAKTVMELYGIGRSTVYDVRYAKDKIRDMARRLYGDSFGEPPVGPVTLLGVRENMRAPNIYSVLNI